MTDDGRVASPPGCEASPSAASGVFAESHGVPDAAPSADDRSRIYSALILDLAGQLKGGNA